MSKPHILLTNDDGIDSVGLHALYDGLSSFADVTAVAPAADQSAVGRALSDEVAVVEHELGYALEGTPADCTIAGLEALTPDADLVVAGTNKGANLGAYVLGRSGTVSAAVEAAFFDVPAIAVSLYIPAESGWKERATDEASFAEATDAAVYLAKHARDAGVFETADYLNVNAPLPGDEPAEMRITHPSRLYEMTAEYDDSIVRLRDRIWDYMRSGDVPDAEGSDRQAVIDGHVSVSPLTAPHTTEHHDALTELATTYRDA